MVSDGMSPNASALEMQDGSPKQTKVNRTKIAVTVILGTLVLGFIILGTVLLTGQPTPKLAGELAEAQRRDIRGIDLEEAIFGRFIPKAFNGTFISDKDIMYKDELGDIVKYNIENKQKSVLLSGAAHPVVKAALSYQPSADLKYMLIVHNSQRLFRYSSISQYTIINLETEETTSLTSSDGYRLLLHAVWAPKGNAIAFVAHSTSDIYYKPSVTEPAKRVTNTGIPGIVYNGVPDWVNEEEIFSSNEALWFSPDGSQLAYGRFNDSQTRIMSIPYYGIPGNLDFQYTKAVNIRYPKPGTPNPIVSLHVASVGYNGVEPSVEVLPPQEIQTSEPILASVVWSKDNQLVTFWLNRVQNQGQISICKPSQQTCKTILKMNESKGWITLVTPPKVSEDGSKVVLVLPQPQGSGEEFRHVCIAEKESNGEYKVRPLTKGNTTVTEIVKYNEKEGTVTYQAIEQEHPERQQVYEVSTKSDKEYVPKCLSCDVKTSLQKKSCLYNSATFGDGDAYALSCLGPGVPEVTIRDKSDSALLTWESNRHIFEDVRSRQLPLVERLKVKVPGGHEAVVQLHFPPDIDKSGKKKYPLIINVYGGPDSSLASEKFNVDWSTYLSVNKSIIYGHIDGRGSGNKGQSMLFSVYRHLGSNEVEDQISVTKYIQDKYSFVDKNNTVIWGWSYGGYATAMALIKDRKNVFKCGMSVAPVSDWALYDTIYTERFMGLPTPDDNLAGYALSELNDKVGNLRNKQYLLVHGTLDDNVHYQQSMMLSKALEHNDILFRSQTYPDEEHSLGRVRHHLYHTMERFLDDCFKSK